jgi:hypothetical protein
MKINLEKNFRKFGSDEEDVVLGSMGKLLGDRIYYSSSKHSIKMALIAEDLFRGKTIEVDPEDYKLIEDFITDFNGFDDGRGGKIMKIADGLKAQILIELKRQKEEFEKVKNKKEK